MNIENSIETRDKLLNYFEKSKDLKYRNFNKKIIKANNIIGVRTPELKRIAKIVAKNDYKNFFKYNKHEFYEENLLHGLVLGYLKIDFNNLKLYIDEFLPFIDNWAVCDMTAANLKQFKKNKTKDICFNEIKKYINSENSWISRFGYILLLDYFIEDKYIDEIFELCESYKDDYYVKMGIAWLISMCYIKFKGKTLTYLKKNKLDNWTYNKAIQKMIESNRITIEDKNVLKAMKKKNSLD